MATSNEEGKTDILFARTMRYFVVTLVLTVLSILFQVIGYVCPGWYVIDLRELGGMKENIGLWYQVLCYRVGPCFTYSVFDRQISDGARDELVVYEVLASFALVLSLVVLVLVIQGRPAQLHTTTAWKAISGVVAALLSCILSLVSAGKFANKQTITASNFKRFYEVRDILKFPYALFLFGFGGAMLLLVAILLTVREFSYDSSDKSYRTSDTRENCAHSDINSAQERRLNSQETRSSQIQRSSSSRSAILQEQSTSGDNAHAPYLPSYDESMAEMSSRISSI